MYSVVGEQLLLPITLFYQHLPMREEEPKAAQERQQAKPPTPGEPALSSQQGALIGKLDDYAFILGIDISRAALRRLVMGQTVNIDGERYRAGVEGVLYRVHDSSKKSPGELIARFENVLRKTTANKKPAFAGILLNRLPLEQVQRHLSFVWSQ